MSSQDKVIEKAEEEHRQSPMTVTSEAAEAPTQREQDLNGSFESGSEDDDYSESESENGAYVEEGEHMYEEPVDANVEDGDNLVDNADDGHASDSDSFIVLDSSPRLEDGPMREDLCDDESLLVSAIDELPVSATSALRGHISDSYKDEVPLSEENAASMADSSTMVSSSTNVGDRNCSSPIEFVASPDEDTVDKLAAQLRLVEQQRRQVIRENMTMTWQKSSLEFMLDRNAAEINGLKEALRGGESEAAQLRSQIDTLSKEAEDRVHSVRQLEYQVTDRQAQIDEMTLELRRLRAERRGHEEAIGDLTRTKDEDDLLISRLVKEKADMQFAFQQFKEDMEKKDLASKTLVDQLTQEKTQLKATLERVQCEFIDKQVRYEDKIHDLQDYKECCEHSTKALKNSISITVSQYTSKIEQFMKYITHLEKTITELREEASNKEGQYKQEIDQLTDEKVKLELTMRRNYNEFTEKENEDQKAIDDLEEVKTKLTRSLAQCQQDFASENAQRKELAGSVQTLTDALLARESERAALMAKVSKLEEEVTRLNEQVENQKAMLQAEHNSNHFINNEIESLKMSLKTAYETIDSLEKQVAQLTPPAPTPARNIRNAVLSSFSPRRAQAPPSLLQPAPAHPLQPTPSTSRAPPATLAQPAPPSAPAPVISPHPALSGRRPPAARSPPRATFECPICQATFSALAPLQEHVDYCLN